MKRLGAIVSCCAALTFPAIARAQNATLEICNNGRLDVVVAVAARIQTFITGYKWTTQGWFKAATGQCTTVYDEEYQEAGPYTPQSIARVVFVTTRLDGQSVAYHSTRAQSGWMRTGVGQICVNRTDAFTYEEHTKDPADNCQGILLPVAGEFVPDGPGKFTYTMDWEGYGDFVAVGKSGQPKSTVATKSTSDSVDNSLSGQFLRALANAARDAQKDTARNAAVVAAPVHASIRYLCTSTDLDQKAVYFSGIFELPDAGSDADNFIAYQRAKIHFQTYLVEKYNFPDAEDLVDCAHQKAATPGASAAIAAQKQRIVAQAVAAKKPVVETGWRDASAGASAEPSNTEATRADVEAFNEKGKAAMLQWVREDLSAYLDASRTGFAAYKSGEPQLSQGYRMWTSSVKPALATGCWVIQGDSTSTLSCAIPLNKESERAYYTQITDDITASLPADWKRVEGPVFGGSLPSTGYRSSSGAHGEVWLKETADQNYELDYQLVSAPTGSKASKPADDDDPIGGGGFITPTPPPAPPSPP